MRTACCLVAMLVLCGCSAPFCVGRSCRLFGHEMLEKPCVRDGTCKSRPATPAELKELKKSELSR